MGEKWQLVLCCWGDKYNHRDINRLHRAAQAHSPSHVRTVLIADRDRPSLEANIQQVEFPSFFLQDRFLSGGCQAKLAMFEKGVLKDDIRAIFVDLDSAIFGDLSRILPTVDERHIALLQSTLLPAGRISSMIHRLSKRRMYTRGNSSIVVFKPSLNHAIADEFRQAASQDEPLSKFCTADERFISWCAQTRLRYVSRRLAVKFTREYMASNLFLARLFARLPGTDRRRANLVFLTFNQDAIKPWNMIDLLPGETIRDSKGRITSWSDDVMGPSKQKIEAFFRA